MSKYVEVKLISQCYHGCPFFDNTGHEMQCLHPVFEDKSKYKSAYDKMIITQENSRNRVPDDCPVKAEETTEYVIHVKLA